MWKNSPLKNFGPKHFLLIGGILLINILQSAFTGLHTDEGYYWLYSQNLSWGYFDHPPMVALLIRLGDLVMHNQLGVRLFMIIVSAVTTIFIIKETNEKEDLWFLALFLLSFPLFHTHLGGFLALPDIPLVFFTFLFFLTYRRFLEKPNLNLSLTLAFLVAAMIYSKYHAFLVIGLTVLSNLKLLKNKYFWLTVFVALILLAPHFYWQFDNNFPSFRYHLHDRTKPFQLKYAIDNIINQLIMMGPLTFPIIIWALTKFRVNKSDFNRVILYNILGFFIVLFFMSFKNRIEAHWTVVITPLIMLATYPVIKNDEKARKWFKRLATPALILFLCFRFYLAADFLPEIGKAKSGFYKRAASSAQVKEMANGRRVASFNNFAFPGIYEFYTGDKALHLASPGYRFCQFDLTQDEHAFDGDSLFIIVPDRMGPKNLIKLVNGKKIDTLCVSSFQSLKGLQLQVKQVTQTDSLTNFQLLLDNKTGKTIRFKHVSQPAIAFMQNNKELFSVPLMNYSDQIAPDDTLQLTIPVLFYKTHQSSKMVIYTRTKEENRGELISIDLD